MSSYEVSIGSVNDMTEKLLSGMISSHNVILL